MKEQNRKRINESSKEERRERYKGRGRSRREGEKGRKVKGEDEMSRKNAIYKACAKEET